MRKEQKEIDGLGPIGIVREGLKLFSTHFKFFMTIQLAILLPTVVAGTLAIRSLTYWNMPGGQPTGPPAAGGAPALAMLASYLGALAASEHPSWVLALALVGIVLLVVVFTTASLALASLPAAVITYAVGLHYRGQRFCLCHVLRDVTPRLWMRLFIITLYKVLLLSALAMVPVGCSSLLLKFEAPLAIVLLGMAAFSVLIFVGTLALELVFMIAAGVAVLEKDSYGWAAVRRARKLLKGRTRVAILFQLLLLVASFCMNGLEGVIQMQIPARNLSAAGSLTATAIVTLAFMLWRSFLLLMTWLCGAVQYLSFKSYHDEELAEPATFEKHEKAGYKRIPGSGADAKLGGQKAESLVQEPPIP